MKRSILFAATLTALGFASASHAIPFTVTSQLTGDVRPDNPDNIVIDVSIVGDTDRDYVDWVVDLNSPLHPTATLGTFAFNVSGSFADYVFSLFTPAGWSITNGNNVPGSGGVDFLFESNDPPQSGNNVTNSVNLTFRMTNLLGNFTEDFFLDAVQSCSSEEGGGVGCGQMGAHVRSLGANGRDSGFAMGDYEGPPPTNEVPEPATLSLLGLGLLGLGFAHRRRKH